MKDNKGLIGYILLVALICLLCVGYSYWIATSDLPDWFKFWLLK